MKHNARSAAAGCLALGVSVLVALPSARADEPVPTSNGSTNVTSPQPTTGNSAPQGEYTQAVYPLPAPQPVYTGLTVDSTGEYSEAPVGYHYEKKSHLAPIIVGVSGFGLGYLAAAATGFLGIAANLTTSGPRTDFPLMFIPIAGPFAALASQPENQRSDGFTAALSVMGGAQIAGASVLIAGIAMGKRTVLVEDKPKRVKETWAVLPVVSPDQGGVAFHGTF
ncbi:MAG: hypothetical protein IPK82_26980 [Polyangiaceae bacterium]|nr:hypothetical protein [Polyangiaceae bacterium]